jgi:hypothetical protein
MLVKTSKKVCHCGELNNKAIYILGLPRSVRNDGKRSKSIKIGKNLFDAYREPLTKPLAF